MLRMPSTLIVDESNKSGIWKYLLEGSLFLNGPIPASFFFIFVFSLLCNCLNFFANFGIQTADLWCWKQLLCQLCHNHCREGKLDEEHDVYHQPMTSVVNICHGPVSHVSKTIYRTVNFNFILGWWHGAEVEFVLLTQSSRVRIWLVKWIDIVRGLGKSSNKISFNNF